MLEFVPCGPRSRCYQLLVLWIVLICYNARLQVLYVYGVYPEGGLDELAKHFKSVHLKALSKTCEPGNKFVCGQDNCTQELTVFKTMRHHISVSHCIGLGIGSSLHVEHCRAGPALINNASASLNETRDIGVQCSGQGDTVSDVSGFPDDDSSFPDDDSEDNGDDSDDEDDSSDSDGSEDPDDDDGDEPEDDGVGGAEPNLDNDPRYCAASLLLHLLGKANMTHSLVRVVIDRVERLVNMVTQDVKNATVEYLDRRNIPRDEEYEQLIQKFSPPSPFYKMKSTKGQESTFSRYFNYIKPELKNLPGYRYEQRLTPQGNYV